MLKKWIFFVLVGGLFASSLIGETIGNVEYYLPLSQKWKIASSEENQNSHSIFYIPDSSSEETTQEVFGVYYNAEISHLTEKTSLEFLSKVLKSYFPGTSIQFRVLDNTSNSILCEWSINDKITEKMHGLSRVIFTDQGSTILTYQTEDLSQVDQQRPIWIQVLNSYKAIPIE